MSEQAWSKEPWRCCGADRGGCKCGQVWSVPCDMPVATFDNCERGPDEGVPCPDIETMKANAARAVSCVNALAGVPKPEGIPEAIRLLRCIANGDDGQGCGAHQHDDIDNAETALRACGIEP